MQKENQQVNKPTLQDYLQWDIFAWSKALLLWEKILKNENRESQLALEIGSKNGGLSLYLANEFNFNVICSDITEPTAYAVKLHKKFNANKKIEYKVTNALTINFDDNIFDVVIFKSVLGSIGKNDNYEKQREAINEMHRVLKTGGILLFAENGKASFFHNIFRKIFRKWASYWRYISMDEMSHLLENFKSQEIKTTGFISAFLTNTKIKKAAYRIDNFLEKLITEKFRYVIYGYAIK